MEPAVRCRLDTNGQLLDFQRVPTQEIIAAIQALNAAEPAS